MSEARYTPGPWEWDAGLVPPDGPERYADIYKDGGDLIIARFNDLIPEGRANARLIAAAPELLEALKRLAVQMNNLLMVADVPERFAAQFNDGQRQAEAAIAKAEAIPSHSEDAR